jgi:hypothetical protein
MTNQEYENLQSQIDKADKPSQLIALARQSFKLTMLTFAPKGPLTEKDLHDRAFRDEKILVTSVTDVFDSIPCLFNYCEKVIERTNEMVAILMNQASTDWWQLEKDISDTLPKLDLLVGYHNLEGRFGFAGQLELILRCLTTDSPEPVTIPFHYLELNETQQAEMRELFQIRMEFFRQLHKMLSNMQLQANLKLMQNSQFQLAHEKGKFLACSIWLALTESKGWLDLNDEQKVLFGHKLFNLFGLKFTHHAKTKRDILKRQQPAKELNSLVEFIEQRSESHKRVIQKKLKRKKISERN